MVQVSNDINIVIVGINDIRVKFLLPEDLAKIVKKSFIFNEYEKLLDECIFQVTDKGNDNVEYCVFFNDRKVENLLVDRNTVIFRIFVDLEQIITDNIMKKNCHIIGFHAGAFEMEDTIFAIMQEKKRGKTTLISTMCQKYGSSFISDDIILCNEGETIGIPVPIRSRSDAFIFNRNNIICESKDFDYETRFFFLPDNVKVSNKSIDIILVPHYDENNNVPRLENIVGSEKVKIIMSNIKEVMGIKNAYYFSVYLAKSCIVYKMYYANSDEMCDLFLEVCRLNNIEVSNEE